MAGIQKKTRKGRATLWVVRWTPLGGSEKSKSFSTQAEAKRFRTIVEPEELGAARTAAVNAVIGTSTVTFGEAWERFVDVNRVGWAAGTTDKYQRDYTNHIEEELGKTPVTPSRLTPELLGRWLAGRAEKLAPSTTEVLLRELTAVLNFCVSRKWLTDNPADALMKPTVERKLGYVPEADEVLAVRAALDPRLRVFVDIATYLGCRSGEARGLTRDRVWGLDDDRQVHRGNVRKMTNEVLIDRQVLDRPRRFGIPKGKRPRQIVLPDALADALARHERDHGLGTEGTYLWAVRDRGLMGDPSFYKKWNSAIRKAGVESFTPKGLRHFYATTMLRRGVPLAVVSENLGHSSYKITFDSYWHALPKDKDQGAVTAAGLLVPDDETTETRLVSV